MMISRTIVDRIHNEFNARFLEKNSGTGLWNEVKDRRALEKTAQALRDGVAPLKKKLAAELSKPAFLDALFQDDMKPSTSQDVVLNGKKHRRTAPAPSLVADDTFSSAATVTECPPPKRHCSDSRVTGCGSTPDVNLECFAPLPWKPLQVEPSVDGMMHEALELLSGTGILPLEHPYIFLDMTAPGSAAMDERSVVSKSPPPPLTNDADAYINAENTMFHSSFRFSSSDLIGTVLDGSILLDQSSI